MARKQTKARWRYRFANYQKALNLLSEAMDLADERDLSTLEEEGVIQRFEYTWELAWKLLADLLSADGAVLETTTPRTVVRAASAAKIIKNADTWMDALDARNKMAHTYDVADFEAVVEEIRETYLDMFKSLEKTVSARAKRK